MKLRDRLITSSSSRWLFPYVAIVLALSCLWYTLLQQKLPVNWGLRSPILKTAKGIGSGDAITSLFRDFRVAVDADNFTGLNGAVFTLPSYKHDEGPIFQNSLGRRVLILDADTRPLDGPGNILNTTWSDLTKQSHQTKGLLSHYLFAKIHGYDYKLVHVQNIGSRFGTWAKVPAIQQTLEHYQFVVFLDADAIFTYPHLPLEWLFNYWGIDPETLVALAVDPNDLINHDDRGNTFLNTGFIIAQKSPRTKELFQAWESCPDEIRYENCAFWRNNWPHEQGAFGTHIRYDFNRPTDIKALPCAEANGCPEAVHTGCVGQFVRHYWYSKPTVSLALDESIQRYFLPYLHRTFHGDAEFSELLLEPAA